MYCCRSGRRIDERRLRLGDFDAIDKVRPARFELVADRNEVLAVGRNVEAEVAIGAARIVVVADRAALSLWTLSTASSGERSGLRA